MDNFFIPTPREVDHYRAHVQNCTGDRPEYMDAKKTLVRRKVQEYFDGRDGVFLPQPGDMQRAILALLEVIE